MLDLDHLDHLDRDLSDACRQHLNNNFVDAVKSMKSALNSSGNTGHHGMRDENEGQYRGRRKDDFDHGLSINGGPPRVKISHEWRWRVGVVAKEKYVLLL